VTPGDWAGFVLAIVSTLAVFIGGLRYLVRGWLWTLTPIGKNRDTPRTDDGTSPKVRDTYPHGKKSN
jgi:hypothetical protein